MFNLKSLLKKPTDKPTVGNKPEFDITGNANKRIDHNTPAGVIAKPVFKDTTPEEPDDEETKQYKLARAKARAAGVPLQEANTVKVSKADRENVEFMTGLKQAALDKGNDVDRDLSGYSADWVRGYKVVKRSSWWDKVNDRLTGIAANLGHSYGKR